MADDAELEAAFGRGRWVGQREGLAFRGVPSIGDWLPGAQFQFRHSWFDSFVEYERGTMWNLRLLQRMRWLSCHRHQEARTLPRRLRNDAALNSIEWEIKDELWEARWAVDAEIEEGHGRACVVAALRALPQRPAAATEYPDVAAFVAEDPRRGIAGAPKPELRAGAAFGYDWRLENPFRRWETSRWRISWLCDTRRLFVSDEDWEPAKDIDVTDELYACETIEGDDGGDQDGRIWLLGTPGTRASVDRALDELRRHAINDRNSLVAATDAVARMSRQEQWPHTD